MSSLAYKTIRTMVRSQLVPWRTRRWLLHRLGAQIGDGSRIEFGAEILDAAKFRVGRNVFINHYAYVMSEAGVTIEDDVRIGPFFRVLTIEHQYDDGPVRRSSSRDRFHTCTIGRGSALGIGVTVLPGADIAPGCVIAASAVVVRSTEPNGLYAGVPARRIRDLN